MKFFDFASRQNATFVFLLFLIILTTSVVYKIQNPSWIVFREAENKYNGKDYQSAISLYIQSLKKGPTSSQTIRHLADSYVAEGNFPEAIHWYKNYLESHPKDRDVRLALARALSWNGNFVESEEQYQILMKERT